MADYILYCRVSTEAQGESKLGLVSQQRACERYIDNVGGNIIKKIIEVESATSKDKISIKDIITVDSILAKRPSLREAILLAAETKATIVVSEMDRLTRHSLVYNYLANTDIDIVFADSPNDTSIIKQLKVAQAEEVGRQISEKTIKSLKVKKRQGVRLGRPKQDKEYYQNVAIKAAKTYKERFRNNPLYIRAQEMIAYLRDRDGKSWQEISDRLTELGITTPNGGKFNRNKVSKYYHERRTEQAAA